MRHKIVAGLRTKNEEWIIDKTLNVLDRFCDTVVCYDDQSIDRTKEICTSYSCVDWREGPERNPLVWEAGKQFTELVSFMGEHDPDYVLLLDADEIPTPSIINFLNTIDENINLWEARMVNLWGDDQHYRTDSFVSTHGNNINWNPFVDNAWTKHVLYKYDKDYKYSYEPLRVGLGGVGRYHPAPNNTPGPIQRTEDFYIIHYGKISPSFVSGEKLDFYAKNDDAIGRQSYKQALARHHASSGLNPNGSVELVKVDPSWHWS